MKFLYLQDFHLSGRAPINRIDNYYQSLLLKLDEVLLLAKKNKVDFILDGGDFLNSELVSLTIVDDVLDRIEKARIKWYMLFGNHPMICHSIENSKATSLQHMFNRSKYVKHLTSLEFKDCIIQGFEYEHNCENKIKEEGLMCKNVDNPFKIAIVHALITEKPLMPQIMHIPIKDVKTDFDVVFVAHNHRQWGIIEQNGVKFVNIGCLGRTGIDEVDVVPKIAIINTSTYEIKLIPLESAKAGGEVFNLEKIETAKAFEGEIDNFISSLSSVKFQSLSVRGLTAHLAKVNNIEKEVIDEVIKRIGENEDEKNI